MITSSMSWLVDLFAKPAFTKNRLVAFICYALIFLAITFPVLILGYFNYSQSFQSRTELIMSERAALAHLAATEVQGKLDQLKNVGMALASNEQIVSLVQKGKWNDAIVQVGDKGMLVTHDITTVFLATPDGVVQSVYPSSPILDGVIGGNFSYRDWYKGVSKDWKPYVSEVYLRAIEPKYHVIAVALPVVSTGSDHKIVGILVLQIKTDTLFGWSREVESGQGGETYFVDQYGHVLAHPKYAPQGDIIDFSSVPIVQKIIKGESGVEESHDPFDQETQLSAYEQVSGYGWGIVVEQPAALAFASRTTRLYEIAGSTAITTLLAALLAYFVLLVMRILNETRRKEKIILESVGDGLVAIDRSWTITLWNRAASTITGWTEAEALGKPFRTIVKFFNEQDRKENVVFIEDAMVSGKVLSMSPNTLLIKKDGSEIPVGDSAAPILDSQGKVDGAIIVFRDTTKEKEAQMISSDYAYASHQLRTPVSAALWSLETLMREKDLDKIQENARNAHKAIESVNKLASELIEVSEIDQHMTIPDKQTLKPADVFDEIASWASEKAQQKGIRFKITPVSVNGGIITNKKLLKRIVEELLDNAIMYNKPGGEVEMTISFLPDTTMRIEIRDSGRGIAQSELPLVFTKFFRGSNKPSDVPGGGLGLYIAKAYTKLLGGQLWFRSEEGAGTTAYVSLPIG